MEGGNFYQRPQKQNRQKARLARRANERQALIRETEKEAPKLPNYQKIESVAMKQKFEDLGLVEKDIYPDGHCLYAAFADQLMTRHGICVTYQNLRQEAAAYIRSHPDTFLPFLVDETSGETRDVNSYSDEIENTAAWGGEMEIIALAKSKKVPVYLVQKDGPEIKIEVESGKDPIRLAYYRHMYGLGAHYNSLRDKTFGL